MGGAGWEVSRNLAGPHRHDLGRGAERRWAAGGQRRSGRNSQALGGAVRRRRRVLRGANGKFWTLYGCAYGWRETVGDSAWALRDGVAGGAACAWGPGGQRR